MTTQTETTTGTSAETCRRHRPARVVPSYRAGRLVDARAGEPDPRAGARRLDR